MIPLQFIEARSAENKLKSSLNLLGKVLVERKKGTKRGSGTPQRGSRRKATPRRRDSAPPGKPGARHRTGDRRAGAVTAATKREQQKAAKGAAKTRKDLAAATSKKAIRAFGQEIQPEKLATIALINREIISAAKRAARPFKFAYKKGKARKQNPHTATSPIDT